MAEQKKAIQKRDFSTMTIQQMLADQAIQRQISLALPKHFTADRLIRVALTAINRIPDLRECTPLSVLACIMEFAALGLEPNTPLGLAYMVPFKNKHTQKKEATPIIGYRGFIDLAGRSGKISSVSAQIVRSSDEFRIEYGTDRSLHHVPTENRPKDDGPSNWKGAYAIVVFKDSGSDFEWMMRADILAIKSRSRAADSGPWSGDVNDQGEMWKKTVIRRIAKRLPLSPEDRSLGRAAMIDEGAEHGLLRPTETGFEMAVTIPEEETIEAPTRTSESQSATTAEAKEPEKKEETKSNGGSGLFNQESGDALLTAEEVNKVWGRAHEKGWKKPEVVAVLKKEFGVDQPSALKRSQMNAILDIIDQAK